MSESVPCLVLVLGGQWNFDADEGLLLSVWDEGVLLEAGMIDESELLLVGMLVGGIAHG